METLDMYETEVLKTLNTDKSFENFIDRRDLERDLQAFEACSTKLEIIKKQMFYGKGISNIPSISPVKVRDIQVLHAKLGISGEAGEIWGAETSEEILNEAGDLLWYLTVLLSRYNFSLKDAQDYNINKLRKRYKGQTFTREEALNRVEPDSK